MPENLGYLPDSDEQRQADRAYGSVLVGVPSGVPGPTPDTIPDLAIPIRDQGDSNFCVRFAMCRAYEALGASFVGHYSPLFLAWQDAMPGDQGRNTGTQIYLSANAATVYGIASEQAHPWERLAPKDYMIRMKVRPSDAVYEEARRHQVVRSMRVPDGDAAMVAALLEQGRGVVFGTAVRATFRVRPDGILENTGAIRGYHAMFTRRSVMVGSTLCARVENSWGTSWGKAGTCLVPMDAVERWTDLRVLQEVE